MYILLYGMSGSGKTTISKELQSFLHTHNITSTIIPMDYFYNVGEQKSYDVPDAFDWKKLRTCLHILEKNEPYTLYPYDYTTHTYEKHLNHTIYNSDVIIIEGIYSNYAKFLFLQEPVVVRIQTDADICLARRILRDETERNIPYDDTIHMWLTNVRPNWNQYNKQNSKLLNTIEDTYAISGKSEHKYHRLTIYQSIITNYILIK